MSKSGQATPGPWYASGNGVHIRKGTVGLCVATAHDPNDPSHSTEVCHANARLIAAAPQLLAAIEELIGHYAQEIGLRPEECVSGPFANARAALAAARETK